MDTVLLFVILVLLYIDWDEHKRCHRLLTNHYHRTLSQEVRSAEQTIKQRTDQAVIAMLDEARRQGLQ